MPIDVRCYTPEWRAFRKERLQQAKSRCEVCGIADRAVRENAEGESYMVYLSIAHCNQYETWKADAETMVLCQRCHRRYDRQFRRKPGARDAVPIGYAALYIQYRGRKALAGMTRTLDQLAAMVAALPSGTELEIQLVMLLAVVGNGLYIRHSPDSLVVVAEYGSCIGLAAHLS